MNISNAMTPIRPPGRAFASPVYPGVSGRLISDLQWVALPCCWSKLKLFAQLTVFAASVGVGVNHSHQPDFVPILDCPISVSGKSVLSSATVKCVAPAEALAWPLPSSRILKWHRYPFVLAVDCLRLFVSTTARMWNLVTLMPGAPELRPDSRYNLDNDFPSSQITRPVFDVLLVMVAPRRRKCARGPTKPWKPFDQFGMAMAEPAGLAVCGVHWWRWPKQVDHG